MIDQKRYEHVVVTSTLNDYYDEITLYTNRGWELIQVMPLGNLSVEVFMKRPIMDSHIYGISNIYYVFTIYNGNLKQDSIALPTMKEADQYVKTMKEGGKGKGKEFIILRQCT